MYVTFHPTPPVRVAQTAPKLADVFLKHVPSRVMKLQKDIMTFARPEHTPATIQRELRSIENPNSATLKRVDGPTGGRASYVAYKASLIESLELTSLAEVPSRHYGDAANHVLHSIVSLPIDMRAEPIRHIVEQVAEKPKRNSPALRTALARVLLLSLTQSEPAELSRSMVLEENMRANAARRTAKQAAARGVVQDAPRPKVQAPTQRKAVKAVKLANPPIKVLRTRPDISMAAEASPAPRKSPLN